MRITPDNSAFFYTGRIDLENAEEPLFIYAGSIAETKFTGASVGIYIKNLSMSVYSAIGVLVDNVQYKFELSQSREEQFFQIPAPLADGEHTLVVFKRQAAAHYFAFCGIEIDDGAKVSPPQKNYSLKIDVYGDSVSAGEVTEAFNYEACTDPENHNGIYDNSWFSYPLILGRRLNAQVYDNSQGGLALFDKTGYFCGPDRETLLGLETTYDKLSYVPYSEKGMTKWDFSRFTPDLIIFAVGQNDPAPNEEETKDPQYIRRWKDKYKEIITDLRQKYGNNTKVLLILTVLMHDPRWDSYLDEIAAELNDPDIRRYRFTRCGAATPGHPRLTEQTEMALELESYIRNWLNIK